jgi:hypothetical protein
MPAKKRVRPRPKSTKTEVQPPLKLSKTEEDLLWHMAHGYQLETSSLWDNPILRNLKDNSEVRSVITITPLCNIDHNATGAATGNRRRL